MTWLAVLSWLRKIPREVWIVLAAAILLAGGLRYVYNKGAASQEAETAAVQSKLDVALDANKSNMDTIGKLQDANKRLAEGAEADKKEAAQAVAQLVTERNRLNKALDAAKRNRSRVYARDPEAAAVGAMRVPDSVLHSLRNDADQN